MKNVLFVIDVQNGFGDDADLPVEGAYDLAKNIDKYIKDNDIDAIIMTGDYHPEDHASFKDNGGDWPVHCVNGTDGVKPIKPLGKYINDKRTILLKKGESSDRDEFSALITKENVIDLHDFLESKGIIKKGDIEDEYILQDDVKYIFTGLVLEICLAENARSFNYYRNIFNKNNFSDEIEIRSDLVASLKYSDETVEKYIDKLYKELI